MGEDVKIRRDLVPFGVVLSVVVLFLAVVNAGGARTNPNCLGEDGCVRYLTVRDAVMVYDESGEPVKITKVVMQLSESQLEVIEDPQDTLNKAKSFFVTFYSGKEIIQDCESVEENINEYVTSVLHPAQAWEKVSTGPHGPIYICSLPGESPVEAPTDG